MRAERTGLESHMSIAEHSTFLRRLHAIGGSTGRENDTITLERLGSRETASL